MKIVLGSSSPRRKQLLSDLGLKYLCIKPGFEEKRGVGESPLDYVCRNGKSKARWVANSLGGAIKKEDHLIISADTIVLLDGLVLEKPGSCEEAKAMLSAMSGKTHTVVTALSILLSGPQGEKGVTQSVETEVTFDHLTEQEIGWYVATGEPMDKAGAYAIQGIGSYMVKSINGSWTNVVGLPLSEFIEIVHSQFGFALSDLRRILG